MPMHWPLHSRDTGEGTAGKDTSGQIRLTLLMFTIRARQKVFNQYGKCQFDELEILHLECMGFDHL